MENVHLAIGQLFNADGRTRRTMFWLRLQRFFERAHGHVVADVNVTAENLANGRQQFFFWRCFHHVTVCAGAKGALCEDFFLEGRIDKDQQSGLLSLERLNKLQAVASAQPKGDHQQLRLAFCNLVAGIRNVVRFAANNHIRLRIEIIGDSVAKQRMLFQDQDASFCGGPSRAAHASLSGLSGCEISSFQWTHIVALGGTMVSWGNRMTTVINIYAKFRKTFLMNDGSPWFPLNHK